MHAVSRRILSQRTGLLLRSLTLIQRSKSGAINDASSYDEQFHKIPSGESDLGDQTRLSFQSKDMKESGKTGVASVSAEGFRLVDGSFLYGPVAVFPKTVLSWRVLSPDEITERSLELFFMLQPKLDCLVVGVGDQDNVDRVRRNLVGLMSRGGIGLEVMATEHAISSFNFLNTEGRYVAAALFPPQHLVISEAQHGKAMNMVRSSLDIDSTFVFDLDLKSDGIDALCGRIFGKNSKEALEMEKRIRQIQVESAQFAEENELIREENEKQRIDERKEEVRILQEKFKKGIEEK